MEDRKLKPCPFCGGEAVFISAKKDKRRQSNKIECANKPCVSIIMAAFIGEENIIMLWNRRHNVNPDLSKAWQGRG